MAKELPYFKFEAGEWLAGRIMLEPYNIQGAYISICALYWQKNSEIKHRDIELRIGSDRLKALVDKEFLLVDGDFITIEWLDAQLEERKSVSQKRSEAGAKGGKAFSLQIQANAKQNEANAKQNSDLLKQKQAEEKRIEENRKEEKRRLNFRVTEFKNSLRPFLSKYSKEMIQDFFDYWSEHGEKDRKFRMEKQTSFSIPRRLSTWKAREKEKDPAKKESLTQQILKAADENPYRKS